MPRRLSSSWKPISISGEMTAWPLALDPGQLAEIAGGPDLGWHKQIPNAKLCKNEPFFAKPYEATKGAAHIRSKLSINPP